MLGVDIGQIRVISGDTACTPNEGFTGSSMSVEVSGLCVLRAAATARRLLLTRAAEAIGGDIADLTVTAGRIASSRSNTIFDYWALAAEADLSAEVDQSIGWEAAAIPGTTIGRPQPRIDLAGRFAGGGFIHDLDLPGMMHARIVRPPSFTARIAMFDGAALAARCPGIRHHIDGSFLAILGDDEYAVVKALDVAETLARWDHGAPLPEIRDWPEYLQSQPAICKEAIAPATAAPRTAPDDAHKTLCATYSKPLIAHASIAPSCGLAHFVDGALTVWSSSQGVFNLRGAIAAALGIAAETVTVIHVPGAGCYGHNGADDAALEAALLARAFTPRPVRVQWTRKEELTWSPFGTAMAVALEARLAPDGRISDWAAELWSGPQVRRPGLPPGNADFAATAMLATPVPITDLAQASHAFAGADRNAVPLYDIPHCRISQKLLPGLPFRTSSLRALGGFANIFAIESFIDELAEAAGRDPVDFRLRHLSDPRARRVIERAAEIGGWGQPAESGRARGIAFGRYKNTAGYIAVVAEVTAVDDIGLVALSGAVDAGLAINPDGLLNQIEGGAIQAASWTLFEQVTFDSEQVTSQTWDRYPILRFGQAPRLNFEIVGQDDGNPPLGAGEVAQGPTAAAIANAVNRALGLRIRSLPLNREQIIKSISAQGQED